VAVDHGAGRKQSDRAECRKPQFHKGAEFRRWERPLPSMTRLVVKPCGRIHLGPVNQRQRSNWTRRETTTAR
jgi:hypothetical protein